MACSITRSLYDRSRRATTPAPIRSDRFRPARCSKQGLLSSAAASTAPERRQLCHPWRPARFAAKRGDGRRGVSQRRLSRGDIMARTPCGRRFATWMEQA